MVTHRTELAVGSRATSACVAPLDEAGEQTGGATVVAIGKVLRLGFTAIAVLAALGMTAFWLGLRAP